MFGRLNKTHFFPKKNTECTTWDLHLFKGVGLGYGRQLYFHCLLQYMVICAFENSPSIPSFLATQIVSIGYGQFKKQRLLFLLPFHSCAPCFLLLFFFIYIIAANKQCVIIICLCPQNINEISLSRKNCHRNMLSKMPRVYITHFAWQTFFPLNFKGLSNKKY